MLRETFLLYKKRLQQRIQLHTKAHKRRPMLAIVSILPSTNTMAYMDSIGLVILTFICFLVYTLSAISFCLIGFPIKFWQAVKRSWLQAFLAFWGQTPDSAHQHDVFVIQVCLIFLGITIWTFMRFKKALTEFGGLRTFSRLPATDVRQFPLRKFFRILSPSWLLPTTILTTPTPEQVLEVLQQQEGYSEAQMQELIQSFAPAQEEQPPSETASPSFQLLLSATDRLTATLIGSDGTMAAVPLQDPYAPLVGFLAQQQQGEWMVKEEMIKQVYGLRGGDSFAVHRARCNERLTTRAIDAGFLPQPTSDTGNAEDTAEKVGINLFAYKAEGQVTSWRLIPSCKVEEFPMLNAVYERVLLAQTDGEKHETLSLEDLRVSVLQVMQSYGKGYLSVHQKQGLVWSWAQERFRDYRDKCLVILTYATQRELDAAHQLAGRERREAVQRAAQLYGWSALVNAGNMPDKTRGDTALYHSLRLYKSLADLSAAQTIYWEYIEQMQQKDCTYEPPTKVQDLWPEAVAPAARTRHRHKKKHV